MNAPTEHDPLEIVSTENLERELTLVRGAAEGSLAGVFGPRSITWQVDREAAIFLGAGRALLLQLAHPWIAATIEQHSDTLVNPVGRFHRTFGIHRGYGTRSHCAMARGKRPTCGVLSGGLDGFIRGCPPGFAT
jgi:uncharacterized protein (DUF2236 family)